MWNISLPIAKPDGMDVCPPSSPVGSPWVCRPGFLHISPVDFPGALRRHACHGTIDVWVSRQKTRRMDKPSLQNNKWVRRAAWASGGVAALWAISWLAVPPLLKQQAQKVASEKLGRTVSIGAIDFKPWSLDRKSTRLNSSHIQKSRMPSSA